MPPPSMAPVSRSTSASPANGAASLPPTPSLSAPFGPPPAGAPSATGNGPGRGNVWSHIHPGVEEGGEVIRHVAGANDNFCVFTTTNGMIVMHLADGHALNGAQSCAVDLCTQQRVRIRLAPLAEQSEICDSLARVLYVALTDPTDLEEKFRVVRERLDHFAAAASRNEERRQRLENEIVDAYRRIPDLLKYSPELQKACLGWLQDAEADLARGATTSAEIALTNLKISINRRKSNSISFMVVAALVYVVIMLVVWGYASGVLTSRGTDGQTLILGVPQAIWMWAAVGSATAMLLRAGQAAFPNPLEAARWLLFRPVVGLVMGVMTFLMVKAGLIVFAQSSDPKTPELLWIIAFIGGFSDTLSVGLLERALGRFRPVDDTNDKPAMANTKAELPPRHASQLP